MPSSREDRCPTYEHIVQGLFFSKNATTMRGTVCQRSSGTLIMKHIRYDSIESTYPKKDTADGPHVFAIIGFSPFSRQLQYKGNDEGKYFVLSTRTLN